MGIVSKIVDRSVSKSRVFFRESAAMGVVSASTMMLDRLSKKWDRSVGPKQVRSLRVHGYEHPIFYRRHSSDSYVIEQVITSHEYAGKIALADPRLIIDCGANIGLGSLYFLTKYANVHVIAIEPDADNFAMCQRNLAPFEDRVTLIRAAIWERSVGLGIERGTFRSGWEWAHRVRPCSDPDEVEVQGITLQEVIASRPERVDALKIDIEGAELQVFSQGCDAWLSRVDTILIELHDDHCSAAFYGALANFNYESESSGELAICRDLRPASR